MVRQGLRTLLEREGFEVAGEASSGREAIELVQALKPDIAVLDLSMPILNGIDVAAEILRLCPGTRTILLTMHSEEHQVEAALRAGVRGYLLKTQAAEDLVRAVREVSRGEICLGSIVSRVFIDGYLAGTSRATAALAPRERQVLQLIAEGRTSKEIAVLLELTVRTAESYRSRIMEKLDIHNTAGLVRYAVRRGVVEP